MAASGYMIPSSGSGYSAVAQPVDDSGLSMSTVQPDPSVDQTANGTDGGAANLASILNSIGRWGTTITSVVTGKPVQTTTTGVPIGAPGSRGVVGTSAGTGIQSSGLIWLLAFGAVILLITRR